MTQELVSAIEPIRNDYVDGFAAWLGEQAKTHPAGSGEHLFEIQAQTNFARKLCRTDFVLADGDNAERREYSPKTILGFQPMQGDVDGITAQLSPFRWDNAVIEIPGAIWDSDKVITWFNRWFGFHGNTPKVTARDKPCGVIHICAWVEPGMLRIDFGSASANALGELIPVAAASGATLISIRDASQVAASPGAGPMAG
jgi:hypothetical protein